MQTTVDEPDQISDLTGETLPVREIVDSDDGQRVALVDTSGGQLRLPLDVLDRHEGGWTLPCSWSELGEDGKIVIPIVEEQVDVQTRTVERGRVRVTRRVHEEEVPLEEDLEYEEAEIERVRVDRWVEEAPPVRREGSTLIIPCIEEVLVVQKRLRVREEVHVRLRMQTHHAERRFTVRREEAEVERVDPEPKS